MISGDERRSLPGLVLCTSPGHILLSPAPSVCIGHFPSSPLADFQNGMSAHGDEILADVPSYTNRPPQVQVSEIAS